MCATASAKEHSASLTGLDKGNTMGRGLSAAIASRTAPVKASCKMTTEDCKCTGRRTEAVCYSYRNGGKPQERRGLHVGDDVEQVGHRGPLVIVAREVCDDVSSHIPSRP